MSSELAILDGVTSFNRYLGDLGNVAGPGSNTDAIVRGEIGALVATCIKYTPQATQTKIRQRASYRFESKYAIRGAGDLKLTFNDGLGNGGAIKGEAVAENVWLRSGGKWHIMRGPGVWAGGKRQAPGGARWPDRIWAEYQSLIDQTPEERARLKREWIEKALASQGLARQSWLQMAVALRIEVPGVNEMKLQEAKGSDGQRYLNGTGEPRITKGELTYTLSNAMPALVTGGLDGADILSRAMATREKAFEIALEKGLFQDLDLVGKRYPGLLA